MWLADAEVLAREARARELAASHFSLAGVAAQVQAWLIDEPSDLLCTRLPPTVRDEEAYPAALALGASSALLAALGCVRGWRAKVGGRISVEETTRPGELVTPLVFSTRQTRTASGP